MSRVYSSRYAVTCYDEAPYVSLILKIEAIKISQAPKVHENFAFACLSVSIHSILVHSIHIQQLNDFD